MSVQGFVNVGEFPAGVPARLGDPLGRIGGEAALTGDATGNTANLHFTIPAGHERRFIYVVDWVHATCGGDAGNLRIDVLNHASLANVTLSNTRSTIAPSATSTGSFGIEAHLMGPWLRAHPIWWDRDFGGTDSERAFLTLAFTTNVDLAAYAFRMGGRFFDARILASKDFHRIFPGHGLDV